MDSRYHGAAHHGDMVGMVALSDRAAARGFTLKRQPVAGVIKYELYVAASGAKTDKAYGMQELNGVLSDLESLEVGRILKELPIDYSLWESLNQHGTRAGFIVLDDLGRPLYDGIKHSHDVVLELRISEFRRGVANRKAEAAREEHQKNRPPPTTDNIRSSTRRYD